MLAPQRSVTVTLLMAIAITGSYIVYTQYHPLSVFDRTPLNHILGVVGLAALVTSSRDRAHPFASNQTTDQKTSAWRTVIRNLAPLLILLHSGFHFGSLISIVTLVCLTVLVASSTASMVTSSQSNTPDSPRQRSMTNLSPLSARQYWIDLHAYFSVVLLAFTLVHVLIILYY